MKLIDNNIFIPTRGRVQDQTTLQLLPDSVRRNVILVCHPGEERELRMQWGHKIAEVFPYQARNIGEVRQFCIDTLATTDYITFVDDSLNFHIRADSDTGTVTKYPLKEIVEKHFTEEHREEYIFRIFKWLNTQLHTDKYGMVGVSRRSGNDRVPEDTKENARVCSFWGINRKLYDQLPNNPKFNDMPIKEDFYIYLHFLTNGIPCLMSYKYAYGRAKGSNSAGGCSIYRNEMLSVEMAHRLKEHFPKFVRFQTKKSTKSWVNFEDTVEDVIIDSKKAYNYGRQFRESRVH